MKETRFIVEGISINGNEGHVVGEFTRYASGGYFLHFKSVEGIFMGYSSSQEGGISESIGYDRKFRLSPTLEIQGYRWKRKISKLIRNSL